MKLYRYAIFMSIFLSCQVFAGSFDLERIMDYQPDFLPKQAMQQSKVQYLAAQDSRLQKDLPSASHKLLTVNNETPHLVTIGTHSLAPHRSALFSRALDNAETACIIPLSCSGSDAPVIYNSTLMLSLPTVSGFLLTGHTVVRLQSKKALLQDLLNGDFETVRTNEPYEEWLLQRARLIVGNKFGGITDKMDAIDTWVQGIKGLPEDSIFMYESVDEDMIASI